MGSSDLPPCYPRQQRKFEPVKHQRGARGRCHDEPFMDEIAKQGLPWHVVDLKASDQKELFKVKT